MQSPSAPVLWAAGAVAFLAADAVLVRQGRETASAWWCRHGRVLFPVAVYLTCHLHGRPRRLARFDPLALAAQRLR